MKGRLPPRRRPRPCVISVSSGRRRLASESAPTRPPRDLGPDPTKALYQSGFPWWDHGGCPTSRRRSAMVTRKKLDLPTVVARGFVSGMKDYFAESNHTKRVAIAAQQLSVLSRAPKTAREKAAAFGRKSDVFSDEGDRRLTPYFGLCLNVSTLRVRRQSSTSWPSTSCFATSLAASSSGQSSLILPAKLPSSPRMYAQYSGKFRFSDRPQSL